MAPSEASLLPEHIADTYADICGLNGLHVPESYSNNKTLDELKIRSDYQVTIVSISHTKTNSKTFAEDLSPNNAGMIEGIITPRSELAGKTLRQLQFRKIYEVNPVMVCKSGDWMTVFLLAGLIPLGLAFQKTGTAEYIATTIMNMIGDVPVIVFLAVVGIMTSFFTLVVSNVGATVLVVMLTMLYLFY